MAKNGISSSTMSLGRLNHVGIATPSIERSIAFCRNLLGATSVGTRFDLPARRRAEAAGWQFGEPVGET